MKINYISRSEGIRGYKDSVIAKSEKNDCVVRAIAAASDLDYDKSHSFVKNWFKRQDNRGVYYFNIGMTKLDREMKRVNRKKVTTISYKTMKNGKSNMTVGAFVKIYNSGSYVLAVKGHAFAVKDGSVIGNLEDSQKVRKIVMGAWKIGTK
jgi:hypothetical protein